MKKLIIAAFILLASTVTYAGPIINVHFEIGRKSLDCMKFGICNGGVDVSWKYSTMQIIDETKTLQITFTKEAIKGKEEFFRGNTVSFEEAYVIPADIQKALESRNTITIGIGTYSLIKTSKGFQINIPLK